MEIIGKLIKRLDPVKGTSKAGKEWQKQSFIFEQDDKFNKEICVDVFGDLTKDIKLKLFKDLNIGEQYKVYINISSKELTEKIVKNFLSDWILPGLPINLQWSPTDIIFGFVFPSS